MVLSQFCQECQRWTSTLDTYYILVCPGPKVGQLPSSTTPPCCSLFCARNFIPISDHEKIWILGQLATRRFCKPSNWWRVRISPSRFLFLCVLHSEAQRGHWTLDTTWVAYEIHNYDDAPERVLLFQPLFVFVESSTTAALPARYVFPPHSVAMTQSDARDDRDQRPAFSYNGLKLLRLLDYWKRYCI